jgi:hypothetical protein
MQLVLTGESNGNADAISMVRTVLTRPVAVSIVSVTVFGGGWIFAVITILLFVAIHKPVSGDEALIRASTDTALTICRASGIVLPGDRSVVSKRSSLVRSMRFTARPSPGPL